VDDRAAEHRPVRIDERLLCGILGLLRLAPENAAEAEDHPAVPFEEDTRPDAGPVSLTSSSSSGWILRSVQTPPIRSHARALRWCVYDSESGTARIWPRISPAGFRAVCTLT
jgi:hypothetical protein